MVSTVSQSGFPNGPSGHMKGVGSGSTTLQTKEWGAGGLAGVRNIAIVAPLNIKKHKTRDSNTPSALSLPLCETHGLVGRFHTTQAHGRIRAEKRGEKTKNKRKKKNSHWYSIITQRRSHARHKKREKIPGLIV